MKLRNKAFLLNSHAGNSGSRPGGTTKKQLGHMTSCYADLLPIQISNILSLDFVSRGLILHGESGYGQIKSIIRYYIPIITKINPESHRVMD